MLQELDELHHWFQKDPIRSHFIDFQHRSSLSIGPRSSVLAAIRQNVIRFSANFIISIATRQRRPDGVVVAYVVRAFFKAAYSVTWFYVVPSSNLGLVHFCRSDSSFLQERSN